MFVSNSGSGGYEIANSLRFRASASAYLSRTPGVAGNRRTWTWSGWVKRGTLNSSDTLFHVYGAVTPTTYFLLRFDSGGALYVGNSTTSFVITSQVFRDPSAGYHVVLTLDTTQATAADRLKLYINGSQVTAFSSDNRAAQIALNSDQGINQASAHSIGREGSGALFLDGYLSEVNFIDGQALTPSSFGQTDSNGVWTPKQYSGTYGTNGFYLKFNDGSSTTNLCLDRSGNGNNWTPSGISVTAGATYDWMVDTPTNNYCTLNPLDATGGANVLEANLRVAWGVAQTGGIRGTIGASSGKWYWEMLANVNTSGLIQVGIAGSNSVNQVNPPLSVHYTNFTGQVQINGGGSAAYGATYTTGDVIGIALDMDAGTLVFYKNNVSQGTAATGLTGSYSPWVQDGGGDRALDAYINFGQRPFSYTPPTGFKALCTANLPAVTIANPSSHMQVALATGANIKTSVEALFADQSLMVVKDRANANNWQWFNDVTGLNAILQSNTTAAETTYSAPAGNSVGYGFRAGGSAVTNTSGTITSQVSANTTAGFSIVTYTGTGANATVGHGLGVPLGMIIVKCRVNGTPNWRVWHRSLGSADSFLGLNQTAAVATATSVFNSQSSTTFGIGTDPATNSASAMVAYCFGGGSDGSGIPGFSRIGRYTGNGSADGPFLFFGFRARYILYKRTDTTGNWNIIDTARNPYNQLDTLLRTNLANADETNSVYAQDITANGWKIRSTNVDINVSGGTYIFIAFAESAFGGNNIAPSPAR